MQDIWCGEQEDKVRSYGRLGEENRNISCGLWEDRASTGREQGGEDHGVKSRKTSDAEKRRIMVRTSGTL